MVMTQSQYEEYAEAFSRAEDKSLLFENYYHPDIVFFHPYKGTFEGKNALVAFWNSGENAGHDGVRERLHVQNFMSNEDKVAVELKIEWSCFKDTEYLGPRKTGEVFWGNCAAFYELTNGKFSKVQLYLNLVE